MEKNTIRLNESELNALIEQCVYEVIEEDFMSNIKAAWKGAKQGYKDQKTLDAGADGMQHYRTPHDVAYDTNVRVAKEEAEKIYKQYRYHKEMCNKLQGLYNKIIRKYKLKKTGVGKFEDQPGYASSMNFNDKPTKRQPKQPGVVSTRGINQ